MRDNNCKNYFLFMPYGFDGIHIGGFLSWDVAEEDAYKDAY